MIDQREKNAKSIKFPFSMMGAVFMLLFGLVLWLIIGVFLLATSPDTFLMGISGGSSEGAILFGSIGATMLICAISIIISTIMVIRNPIRNHIRGGILILTFTLIGWGAQLALPAEGTIFALSCLVIFGAIGVLDSVRALRYKPFS